VITTCLGHSKRRWEERSSVLTKRYSRRCMSGCAGQPQELFSRGIHTLRKHWRACIEQNWEYVEKWYSCVPPSFNKLNLKKITVFIWLTLVLTKSDYSTYLILSYWGININCREETSWLTPIWTQIMLTSCGLLHWLLYISYLFVHYFIYLKSPFEMSFSLFQSSVSATVAIHLLIHF
jgi:hypothetical protein